MTPVLVNTVMIKNVVVFCFQVLNIMFKICHIFGELSTFINLLFKLIYQHPLLLGPFLAIFKNAFLPQISNFYFYTLKMKNSFVNISFYKRTTLQIAPLYTSTKIPPPKFLFDIFTFFPQTNSILW